MMKKRWTLEPTKDPNGPSVSLMFDGSRVGYIWKEHAEKFVATLNKKKVTMACPCCGRI